MSLITPDFGLIVWMTVIFGIVLFILTKWGFPIITGMVDRRNERIEKSIAEAREAERKLRDLTSEQEAILLQTRSEKSRILKEAASERDNIISQAREQARDEADRIVAAAKEQIALEKESALRDIRREVALLSVSVAEKILTKDLASDASRQEYADKCVEELSRMN